jgi:methyl-accepting chemotaxis protein
LKKRSSLSTRLVISTLGVVFLFCAVSGAAGWWIASAWINREAVREAAGQSAEVIGRIASIDVLSRVQVESAMRILQDQGLLKGTPSLKGNATLGAIQVPDLHLGAESQVANYAMVDRVKQLAGGTATLFVWDGSNFTRVATNVVKPDGSRAIGTVLDPKGKAFAALSQGQPFNGVVDILGAPYTTSYAPMMDAEGKLVGAWYTGYRLDSISALGKSIEESSILKHGFVALRKPSGAVVFHGKQITDEALIAMLNHPKGWVLHEESYPAWGYSVLTAYPESDVFARELTILSLPALGTFLMVCLIVLLQIVLLKRLVLGPVGHLTGRLIKADLNTLLDSGRDDEIGALAISFNKYVLGLRKTLIRVRDGSAAMMAKTDEIRAISHEAVASLATQCQSAEDAAQAVAELSRNFAGISSHTADASHQARTAADAARQGGVLVTSAVSQIQSLSQQTHTSVGRMGTLSEHAQQISLIVDVIQEIAASTNLLALNASIEAARAGEHGRGFAVVAGEVRRLAERTAQATQEVSGLVSGIASETKDAANDIDSAYRSALQGAETVASLNKTFESIAHLVIEVDGRVEQIAHSAQSEAATATRVSETMHRMASSAQESARGAEQVVAGSGDLLGTAQSLDNMVEQFSLIDLPEDHER